MKPNFKRTFLNLILIASIVFTSCSSTKESLDLELATTSKIEVLENGEWLLKDFEDRVMYAFVNGERLTYYGVDNVFQDQAIPGKEAYTISGDSITLDFNFGNIVTYQVKFSCDNTIVEFYRDGALNTTLYKRNSNYKNCL